MDLLYLGIIYFFLLTFFRSFAPVASSTGPRLYVPVKAFSLLVQPEINPDKLTMLKHNEVLFVQQKSTPQDDHYVGAVVEYQVTGNVATNLVNYASLIKEAADQVCCLHKFFVNWLTPKVDRLKKK